MLPEKRICPGCGGPFVASTPGQEECVSCMIKPHRSGEKKIGSPAETSKVCGSSSRKFKNKTCSCGKTFTPTSPRQIRCVECIAAAKGNDPKNNNLTESEPERIDIKEKEKPEVKNKLSDLNDHLFAQLERLGDENLTGDKLKMEVERGKAISGLAANIIGGARVVLDAHIAQHEYNLGAALPMIEASPAK